MTHDIETNDAHFPTAAVLLFAFLPLGLAFAETRLAPGPMLFSPFLGVAVALGLVACAVWKQPGRAGITRAWLPTFLLPLAFAFGFFGKDFVCEAVGVVLAATVAGELLRGRQGPREERHGVLSYWLAVSVAGGLAGGLATFGLESVRASDPEALLETLISHATRDVAACLLVGPLATSVVGAFLEAPSPQGGGAHKESVAWLVRLGDAGVFALCATLVAPLVLLLASQEQASSLMLLLALPVALAFFARGEWVARAVALTVGLTLLALMRHGLLDSPWISPRVALTGSGLFLCGLALVALTNDVAGEGASRVWGVSVVCAACLVGAAVSLSIARGEARFARARVEESLARFLDRASGDLERQRAYVRAAERAVRRTPLLRIDRAGWQSTAAELHRTLLPPGLAFAGLAESCPRRPCRLETPWYPARLAGANGEVIASAAQFADPFAVQTTGQSFVGDGSPPEDVTLRRADVAPGEEPWFVFGSRWSEPTGEFAVSTAVRASDVFAAAQASLPRWLHVTVKEQGSVVSSSAREAPAQDAGERARLAHFTTAHVAASVPLTLESQVLPDFTRELDPFSPWLPATALAIVLAATRALLSLHVGRREALGLVRETQDALRASETALQTLLARANARRPGARAPLGKLPGQDCRAKL